jgi:hypothetical protein
MGTRAALDAGFGATNGMARGPGAIESMRAGAPELTDGGADAIVLAAGRDATAAFCADVGATSVPSATAAATTAYETLDIRALRRAPAASACPSG